MNSPAALDKKQSFKFYTDEMRTLLLNVLYNSSKRKRWNIIRYSYQGALLLFVVGGLVLLGTNLPALSIILGSPHFFYLL